jgi:hypothetical protein
MVVTDAEFMAAWAAAGGSPTLVSRNTGMSERTVYARRAALMARGIDLQTGSTGPRWAYPHFTEMTFDSGVAVLFSDTHFWPGRLPSVAFDGLLALIRELKPAALIHIGDVIDGAQISRHGRIGWARVPSVKDELGEAQRRMRDIVDAAPKAKRARCVGNHDFRFETYLAANADAFEGLAGTRLSHHLPDWPEAWMVRCNGAVMRHRLRSGIHAAYNNLQAARSSIFTGHTHQLEVRHLTGYGPLTWAAEVGTLAPKVEDEGPEGGGPFEYGEGMPTRHASGFVVATWHKGQLLRPEPAEVMDGVLWFRGRAITKKRT